MTAPEVVQTVVLSVIGIICTGMVPWAFIMERRLSRIEARLTNGILSRLEKLELHLREVEHEVSEARRDSSS